MCMHNGKLLGGNSAFAHLGTYQEKAEEIIGEVITQRHNDDPYYKPLMDTDVAAISVRGKLKATRSSEGNAAPRPGALFWAELTRLDDEGFRRSAPLTGRHTRPQAAARRRRSRPVRRHAAIGRPHPRWRRFLLLPRRLCSADGRWKGEILNQEHTPAKGENPVFGGHEVGIDFTGTCDEAGAELEAIALAGKRSCGWPATLKLMRPA